MKVHLLDPSRDIDPDVDDPPFAEDLAQDLELDVLWNAMGAGDSFLRRVARSVLLHPVDEDAVVRFRQQAYADVDNNLSAIRELNGIAEEALAVRRKYFFSSLNRIPRTELYYAVHTLCELANQLEQVYHWARRNRGNFSSQALRGLCDTALNELDPDYLDSMRATLDDLQFSGGILVEYGIGIGGEAHNPVLRHPKSSNKKFFDRTPLLRPFYSFTLPERDDAGARELSQVRDRALEHVATVAVACAEHVLSFFSSLKTEVGFYLAVHNLHAALNSLGAPLCHAEPCDSTSMKGLYDPCLALRARTAPVGNDVALGDSRLLVITGANGGGKTTLLRALGIAQLMMQAGMPVPADSYSAPLVGHVRTHWSREEDGELAHGKFSDELQRMESIIRALKPDDLLLCNESFASTNESEGSDILAEVTAALVNAGVRVVSVTHLSTFAEAMAQRTDLSPCFLRAQRSTGTMRSFRLEPGMPLATTFGVDIYNKVFGTQLAE